MNRLSKETSLYLRQHMTNPIDWYPWGDEAFERAQKENKPIFLSIGYFSCHWCHVMNEESFNDPEVAQILNQDFISIKVDREERPDIDSFYMWACHLIAGHGGWPMNVFLSSNRQAFFAGTYFPKESSSGHVGFKEVLSQISYMWKNQIKDVHQTIQHMDLALNQIQTFEGGGFDLEKIISKCVQELKEDFDSIHGGFGQKMKFPSPHKLLFLMAFYRWDRDPEVLEMVEKTLQEMHRGSVFDHVHGGFHRYATREDWGAPHFEKTLLDQALLTQVYLEGYQLTSNPLYKWVAEKTLSFVQDSLYGEDDNFAYSSINSGAQGEEGAPYVWSYQELQETLNKQEMELLKKSVSIEEEGDFSLSLKTSVKSKDSWYYDLDKILKKLEQEKVKKQRAPERDEKILSDWNMAWVQTLYRAHEVLGNSKYLKQAQAIGKFLNQYAIVGNRIHRQVYNLKPQGVTLLKDQVRWTLGMIAEYLQAGSEDTLEKMVDGLDLIIQDYGDRQGGGFFETPEGALETPIRTKEYFDGEAPSANSLMIESLVYAWELTGQAKYKKWVEQFIKSTSTNLMNSPSAYCHLMRGLLFYLKGAVEIQILGDWSATEIQEINSILRKNYFPEKIVRFLQGDNKKIQICQRGTCGLPMSEISTFKKELSLLLNP